MRVLVNKAIKFNNKTLEQGRLIHCTREKAWELKDTHGEKLTIWYNWPALPISEVDPYAVAKEQIEEEKTKKSKKD